MRINAIVILCCGSIRVEDDELDKSIEASTDDLALYVGYVGMYSKRVIFRPQKPKTRQKWAPVLRSKT